MIQHKKQKVTLTQLQRYLPFPCPNGNFVIPSKIQRFLLSPTFGNFSFKEQNSIKSKYQICYRNYFAVQTVVQHLNTITNGKYYKHSLQMAVRNAAQKYNLIDWYKFYRAVKLNKGSRRQKTDIQQKQELNQITIKSPNTLRLQQKIKASELIKSVFKQFLHRKKVKKGKQQVQQVKKSLQLKLIIEFAKQAQKQVKQFYEKNNRRLQEPIIQFEKTIRQHKINFIMLESLLNTVFEMYIERKKIIYLYLKFDPQNKGYFSYDQFKQVIFEVKKQRKFVSQTSYLSSIDQVLAAIRKDMKAVFYSAYDMITHFVEKYLSPSQSQPIRPKKDDEIQYEPFYRFINDKSNEKYSKYQIHKVLKRIQFFDNLHFLFNEPKQDQLLFALMKITQKKKKKKQLHSQNEVFYSYKNILILIIAKCKSEKLTKEGFVQFIVSHDATLKYNSFFAVFRVYGNLINIKRIKAQSQLNPFACLLKMTVSADQYDKLYDEFIENYPPDFQLPYSSVLDKINLRLDFLIENSGIKPLPNLTLNQIVNYRDTIRQLFQTNFDIIVRSYIHQKVASKFVGLYRRIKYNKNQAFKMAQNLMSKAIDEQIKKASKKKETIQSNDSKNPRSGIGKKVTTQKSITSCKTKKSEPSQRKYRPEDLQMMKQLVFDVIERMDQQKNDSIKQKLNLKQDNRENNIIKHKIVAIKKDKISFRSNLSNCFAYHELIGLVIFGNNSQFMCYRNQKLEKLDIKLLYRPNIIILGLEVFSNYLILLTSYWTLQMYKLYQPTKYPFKTIKVGSGKTDKVSNNQIQKIIKTGQFGAYPKLLKSLGNINIGINLSFVDDGIWILRKRWENNEQKQDVLIKVSMSKRQHYFNESVEELITKLNKRLEKKPVQQRIRLVNQIIDFLAIIKEEMLEELVQDIFQNIKQPESSQNIKESDNIDTNDNNIQTEKTKNQMDTKINQSINAAILFPEILNPKKPQQLTPLNLTGIIKTAALKQSSKKDLLSMIQHYYRKFLQIIQTKQQTQQGKKLISQYQFLEIVKFFNHQTQKQLFRSQLRQQLAQKLKEHFKFKVPQEIKQVTNTVQDYLLSINYSLKDLIKKLDQQKQGCIKVKKIKDYFLKITQETYLINEKRIDSYLKNIAIAKHVSYDSFVSIFTEWNMKIWEKPRLIVRDFLLVEKFDLLVYTLDDDKKIYIKNITNNRIIAKLEAHHSVPCICIAEDHLILVSGDSSKNPQNTIDLHSWRLYDDVVQKVSSSYALKVKPYFSQRNIHQDGITSVNYLQRSHCIVTTSLDSTIKFHLIKACPFSFSEVERIYFHDFYYLSILVKNIEVQKYINVQSFVSLRIKKHINQKNLNKYEITCQSYDVQKISVKVPKNNEYIDLPMKMVSIMENKGYAFAHKKEKLLAKKVQQLMEAFISTDFLQQSLELNLYSALKRYFIFNDGLRLYSLLHYIEKKQSSSLILENILSKFGLKIIDKNMFIIENLDEKQFIEKYSLQQAHQEMNLSQIQKEIHDGKLKIKIFEEDFNRLQILVSNHSLKQTDLIKIQTLKSIIQMFLFGKQHDKFMLILQFELKKIKSKAEEKNIERQKMKSTIFNLQQSQERLTQEKSEQPQNQFTLIHSKQIFKFFSVQKTQNNIEKLYQCLRQLWSVLRKNKTPVWKLFALFQQNVAKQRYISSKTFKTQLNKLKFPDWKIQIIQSFLAKNEKLSIFQLLNNIEIALKQSSTADVFRENESMSVLLRSSIISQQEEILQKNEIFRNSQSLDQKTQKMKLRQNSWINTKSIKNSTQKISEVNEKRSEEASLKSSKKQSQNASRKNLHSKERSKSGSRKLTPSNSMNNLTMTRQVSYSNTKDSKKRQVYEIRHKLHNLLNNQKKTLWQLVSSVIPQFLQESIITENQYFDLFKILRSTLKLSQKLSLMIYLKQQNPQRLIDLNDLFELLEDSNKTYIHGEKYLISYFVNKLTSSDENLTIQQALELYFFPQTEEQISLEEVISHCCEPPFKFNHFALKQFEQLLIRQNKSGFIKEDFIDMIDRISQQYQLRIENKNLTILEEIIFKIDKRKVAFEQIFPHVQAVTQSYFVSCIHKLSQKYQKKAILKDFQLVKLCYKKSIRKKADSALASSSKRSAKSTLSKITEIPYAKFKAQMLVLLDETRQSTDKQRQSSRKLVRYLQSKRISMFNFFISLDLQKKFYLNEIQFQTGLTQIGIGHSFWKAISKKYQNRLYYYQFIRYLVDNNVLDIKYIDSELEVAMEKLLKKVIKNTDIQQFYQKLVESDSSNQVKCVSYQSFSKYFALNYSFLNKKEIDYVFSTFCNAQQIKSSKFSNDEVIKNRENLQKTFNYKDFVEIINLYKNQTVTKTPQFKLIDFLKKRNISLVNEMYKFMQKNKKNKDIAEALKKKSTILPKDLIFTFLDQIKSGLSQKELKQILSLYSQTQIDFSILNQKLEQIYKKASSYLEKQQAEVYLGQIYKKAKSQNVSIERLFSDFCQEKNNKLRFKDFLDMSQFLNTGLNKIQLRKVYSILLDQQNKGFCVLSELLAAIDDIQEKIDKDQQDYQFDYIIEKIENNLNQIPMKQSHISLPFEKCKKIFEKILTEAETLQLYTKAAEHQKKQKQMTEKDIHNFIEQKISQRKIKTDKKYKQLVFTLLNTISKANIDITEVFKYFTFGSRNTDTLTKDRFLLLYQSVISKSDISQVNHLYTYFDENKTGHISLQRWQEKLGIIDLENQNVQGSIDQLKVFYKVKVFLTELYLTFIQKQFKNVQIYYYFDKHSTGLLKYNQFWSMIYELGFEPSEQLQKKVVNYLDRNKAKSIDIRVLMNQLENCLGKKQKMVLQTKTSFIFKKNSSVIGTKYSYFINQLIKKEELIEKQYQQNQVRQESCIMESDFLQILKKFGIYLTEEQLTDLRKNFQSKENYLELYPIYFMLKNIFQETSSFEQKQKSQRRLFKNLLTEMIRNKITLREIEKIKSHEQMKIMLKQLKIFTPIEIQIILEHISYAESSIINPDKLKTKIRDSYVQTPTINENMFLSNKNLGESLNYDQTLEIIAEDDYLNQTLRDHLRSLVKFDNHLDVLELYSKNIYQQDFKEILLKLGCKMKVKDMKKYFKAFSDNKKFIKTENLIFQTNYKTKFLDRQTEDEDYSGINILLQHIQKSLKFTNKNLKKALEKYFIENYGFITIDNLKKFFIEIGYENGKEQHQTINKLLEFYQQHYQQPQKDLNSSQIELSKLQDILSTQEDQEIEKEKEDNQEETKKQQNQKLTCRQLKNLVFDLKAHHLKLIQFLKKNQLLEGFSVQDLYRFVIEQIFPKNLEHREKESFQKIARLFCCHFKSQTLTLKILQSRINHAIKFQFIQNQLQNQTIINQNIVPQGIYQNVLKVNIVQIFVEQVQKLYHKVIHTKIGSQNLDRLSLNILFQEIQLNKHLLFIDSEFDKNYQNLQNQRIQIDSKFDEVTVFLNTKGQIVIETQNLIEQKALTLVNDKYYAVPTTRKQQFDTFAKLASHLNPSSKFIRAKGYYLWEPNTKPLPKCSIRYRWKFIRNFAYTLLNQFYKIHKLGYCCPHLRFSDLNQDMNAIIDKVLYPWKIDSNGKVVEMIYTELFDISEAYSVPQIMKNDKGKVTSKCDSWIFGCLLYEFIWGHQPNSYLEELFKFLRMRNIHDEAHEINFMPEYPVEFKFKFYNQKQILSIYENEFVFDKSSSQNSLQFNIKRWQTFKGLTYPLEYVFGKELIYYQQEFNILSELHQIIFECFNPNPQHRPSIQQLIHRPLFSQNQPFNLKPYIHTLSSHLESQYFFVQNQEKIRSIEQNLNDGSLSFKQFEDFLEEVVNFLNEMIDLNSKTGLIDQIFTIPMNYPWLSKDIQTISEQQNPYSFNILKNKEIIRQNALFRTMTKFFKKNILKKVIKLFFSISNHIKANRNTDDDVVLRNFYKFQVLIQNLLLTTIQMTKSYSNPASGFVQNIIESVLFYIYQNQQLNLKPDQNQLFDSTLGPQSNLNINLQPVDIGIDSSYFNIPKLSQQKQQFIKKLQGIIYINGEGNSQYSCLSDYLAQNPKTRTLIEIFYSALDLMNLTEKCQLAVNYFRDRIYLEEQMQGLMKVLRIQLLVLGKLHQTKLKELCLSYFLQLVQNCIQLPHLFYSHLFYVKLATVLRNPLQTAKTKGIVLQILMKLLEKEDDLIINIMKSSSCDIFPFIVRLLVQPPQNSAAHAQYDQLKGEMSRLVQLIEKSIVLSEIFEQIEGGIYSLKHFKGEQYLGESYNLIN